MLVVVSVSSRTWSRSDWHVRWACVPAPANPQLNRSGGGGEGVEEMRSFKTAVSGASVKSCAPPSFLPPSLPLPMTVDICADSVWHSTIMMDSYYGCSSCTLGGGEKNLCPLHAIRVSCSSDRLERVFNEFVFIFCTM